MRRNWKSYIGKGEMSNEDAVSRLNQILNAAMTARENQNAQDLLDNFAGWALTGAVSNQSFSVERSDPCLLATWAYDVAEVMVKERAKRLG